MATKLFPDLGRKITTSDETTYAYVRVTAKEGKPTLLFVHGYPNSSYDWRHQIEYFSTRGYGLVVPDMLGHGETDKPVEVRRYGLRTVAQQLADILDAEGLSKVIAIGHDWGCAAVSTLCRWHRDRVSGAAFTAVGYRHSSSGDIHQINAMTQKTLGYPIFGYWTLVAADDGAKVIEAHFDSYFSLVYSNDPEDRKRHFCPIGELRRCIEADEMFPLASWLSSEEVENQKMLLRQGGFTGPTNLYKAAMQGIAAEEEAELPEDSPRRNLDIPVLYVRCEKDYTCLPDMNEKATRDHVNVDKLTVTSIDSAHFVQLEAPKQFNEALESFLEKNKTNW